MPTTIYFAAGGDNRLTLDVNEDPETVFASFDAANGEAIVLTTGSGLNKAYVNPAAVAFWHARLSSGV